MAAKKTKFPRTMYQLMPSLNIKEIVLTGPAMQNGWGGSRAYERCGYAADANGKHHYLHYLFDKRADAIDSAERAIAEQEARHKKAGENIAKRRANLEKAKGAA